MSLRRRSRSESLNRAIRVACESLERRTLLCGYVELINGVPHVHPGSVSVEYVDDDPPALGGGPENALINWTNRGSSTSDTDNFNALFGANAATARSVVDQAISNWTRVIDHFNQSGGGNSINVTLSMNTTGVGFGSGATVTWNTGDNKPRSATITMGRGNDTNGDGLGDGAGWFLDPTPWEHREFLGTIFNGYAAQAQAGSPAAGMSDFLTVLDHELGHAVGLIGGIGGIVARTTNTSVLDTVTGPMYGATNAGNYYRWDGNDGSRILWTAHDTAATGNNAGQAAHIAPGTWTNPSTNITYTANRDLMNAYFADGIRTLVSPLHTAMLADALGYTIASSPQSFGTFYNHRLADGRVIMRGHGAGTGADFFSISRSGSFLNTSVTLNAPPAGTGSGATFSMSYFIDPTTNVVMQGDTGPDTFTINPVNLPVSIEGFVAGGSSTADDLVTINGTANAEVFHINGQQIIGANHNITQLRNIARLVLNLDGGADTVNVSALDIPTTINGGAGNDVVNLGTGSFDVATITAPVSFNGGADNDTLNLGNGNADAVISNVIFNGDAGLNNVVYRDASVTYRVEYSVNSASVTRRGFFSPLTFSYFNTDRVIIHAGSDHDLITVGPGVSPIVEAYGNGGDDTFVRSVVNPGGGAIFNGGPGIDTITFDGTAENVGRLWDIYPDRVIYGGIFVFLTPEFESVAVLAGGGDDTITFFGGSTVYAQSILVDGGGGSDLVKTNGARVPNATLRGGGGFDFLNVDDRTLTANLDSYALYPDRYDRYRYDGPDFYRAYYSGFESMTTWRTATQAFVEIFGTSPDIASTHHTWMVGNTSDSVVHVYPRDAQGNLTIQSNIEISAGGTIGTDNIFISDTASSLPMTYRLYNRFANSTAHIDGLGTGWLAVDGGFDSLTFNAGGGDDVFNIDSYRSGNALAINGGGGDDTMNLVPGGKDLGAITSIASFNFNGGPGHDTLTVTNENSASGYAYYVNATVLSTIRIAGGQSQLAFNAASTEAISARGSQQADTFQSFLTDPGQRITLEGLDGNDTYVFGGLIGATMQLLRGPIFIDGGGGQDNIQVRDEEDTVGRTFHIAADSIGAFPGDTLFGPGGSIRFTNIAGTISVNGGSGADTVYATPSASAAITVSGGNPTAAPGDQLYLGLAAAQNAQVTGTAANGSVTSSNLRTLSYNGFETGPTIDDVAPDVVSANINVLGVAGFGDGGPRRQSIDVTFSEDVSALIGPQWLQLTNTTTNEMIPTSNMTVEYNPATNTAHFTFPGYSDGVLPDGDYTGKVLAGLPDFFGNGLPGDVPFSFFFLNGDANRDGVVNLADFNILASNFGQSNRTFSQGDFNYDGVVNLADFNILASRFGVALGAAVTAAPAKAIPFGEVRIDELTERDNAVDELLA